MLKNRLFQRVVGGSFLETSGINLFAKLELLLLSSYIDPDVIRFLKTLRKQRKSLVSAFESYMVYSLAKSTAGLPGDIAEVGVFQGGTSRIQHCVLAQIHG